MNKPDAVDLSLDAEDTGREDWERDFRELLAVSRERAEEVVASLECRTRSVRTTPIWELSDPDLVDAALLARAVSRVHLANRKRHPRETSSEDGGCVASTPDAMKPSRLHEIAYEALDNRGFDGTPHAVILGADEVQALLEMSSPGRDVLRSARVSWHRQHPKSTAVHTVEDG